MLLESSNTATLETNTLGTHLLGDTTQDGLWSGPDLAVMTLSRALGLVSGGKTPATHGVRPSLDTTVLLEISNIATTETNTLGTHQLGDTTQDGPWSGPDHVAMTPSRVHGLVSGGKTPGTHGV